MLNQIVKIILLVILTNSVLLSQNLTYPIVGTGQTNCYDTAKAISAPIKGSSFYGQDAQYKSLKASYTDNKNGTITDNVTGLMWQQTPDFNNDGIINSFDKKTYSDALKDADTFKLGGYSDWRLPTIKELYSLFNANGTDPSGPISIDTIPFIDTVYFPFGYGDEANGERQIDAQYATSTIYVGKVFETMTAMFGVNFADGRIKGYGLLGPGGQQMKYYVKYVRGPKNYGINNFADNKNGTITDKATNLMWSQLDSKTGMNWESSLAWVEQKNASSYLGYNDWRLPNVKELQSILDYTKSPTTSNSAAIDPLFECTKITVEEEKSNYPFYWSSTTHIGAGPVKGPSAMYVCFGQAFGFMEFPPNSGNRTFTDVHGAGSQRSDPKAGNPADFPIGRGPQGDVIRINNFVRLVRDVTGSTGINDFPIPSNFKLEQNHPNPFNSKTTIKYNVPTPGNVNLSLYDSFGNAVSTLVNQYQQAGEYYISINSEELNLNSGIYFYKFVSGNYSEIKSMILYK